MIYRIIPKRFSKELVHFDQDVTGFVLGNKKLFLKTFSLTFLGRLFSPLEIFIILSFLHFEGPLPSFSIVLSGASNLVTTLFSYVPGEVGVMEGGFTLLFRLAGYSTAMALACQLIRRMNAIFWIGVGSILFIGGRRRMITAVISSQT